MDILTHTLSGFAAGSVIASYSSQGWKSRLGILFFSGLGGALPDIDAITMWSKFDVTLGRVFNLQHSGREIYSSKFWYSHHGFMHSLLAALLIAFVIGVLFWMARQKRNPITFIKTFYSKRLLLTGFIVGFVIHLLQDMITPASAWGGVRFFFPSEIYIGGTGDIWWWNNYDLFLIVVFVLLVNFIILTIPGSLEIKTWKHTTLLFFIGALCFCFQILRRDYDFNTGTYADSEKKSKEIQKEKLGNRVYKAMDKIDNSLKVNF